MRRVAAVAVLVLSTVVIPAAPARAAAYAPISGSGSTWSANAIAQWTADVASSGLSVSYSATGSSAGRRDFAQQLNDFGVSEIPFQGVDPATGQGDTAGGRPYAYMPIVAGGTSFMYHLTVNGKLYRDLRLSGETITKIFTGKIKDWSDPAITRDNNGKQLPSKRIVPVVRSDGSGTTAQFTLWMSKQYRSVWCDFYPRCGLTSYYPTFGNAVAQSGSVQMAGYISASYGEGTIGYVEYSYPHNKNYPVAKLLNSAGYYVEPTDFNVAVALTSARINSDRNSPDYLTQVLDDVYRHPDKRAYPLSSYSYMILPTSLDRRITADKGRSLSVFAHYFLCQGQQKAGPLGFSPLPLNLVRAGFEQVAKVPGAEGLTLDPKGCDNPTFDPASPDSNRLATIAPMPPECDKDGQGPCSGGGGPAAGAQRNAAAGTAGPGAAGPNADPSTRPAGGPTKVDPVTGEVVTDGGAADAANAGGVVDVADTGGATTVLLAVAGVEAAFLAFLPLLMARRLRQGEKR